MNASERVLLYKVLHAISFILFEVRADKKILQVYTQGK
jgi:hypothetical protein